MNSSQKFTFNSNWQINLAFDQEAFEITRADSIKKYEENVYLLGNIFSTKAEDNNKDTVNVSNLEGEDEINNMFDESKCNDDDSDDMDQNERIERMVGEMNNNFKTSKEQTKDYKDVIDQLNVAYQEYKDDFKFLGNKLKRFKDGIKQHEDIITKLKNVKSVESTTTLFDECIDKAERWGVWSETFKEEKAFDENKTLINKEPPFNEKSNIIIIPL